jgi:hypothetical protein
MNKDTFSSMTNLSYKLDLSFNILKSLPENAFVTLNSLHNLDVSNNKLDSLPNCVFDSLNILVLLKS